MKFSLVAIFATSAFAALCPTGLYSNPQCCSADVLGIAALDCETPKANIFDGYSFQKACAAKGKDALCCVAPVAGQDLLCVKHVGGTI